MLNLQNVSPNTPVQTTDGRAGVIAFVGSNPYAQDNQPYAYVIGFHTSGGFVGFSWADYFAGEQLEEAAIDYYINRATSPFVSRGQQMEALQYLMDTLQYEAQELTDWDLHDLEDMAGEIQRSVEFDQELIDLAAKIGKWATGTLEERKAARHCPDCGRTHEECQATGHWTYGSEFCPPEWICAKR